MRPAGFSEVSVFNGRSLDVEIASNEALLRDLAAGMRNLMRIRPEPRNLVMRAYAQRAKMHRVERRLFRLKQQSLPLKERSKVIE